MHKILLNTLALDFSLRPDGPILIKSGLPDEDNPHLLNFVRAPHPSGGATSIYLPGSSLKGVIRSRVEQIIRTFNMYACDPPAQNGGCNPNLSEKADGPTTYSTLCLACKMFGSTKMASRFRVQDAYPTQPVDLGYYDQRTLVAIDRHTGAVAQGPFTMEVATSGVFKSRIEMHNFERWQVGLLALALRDISNGEVRIGFGKSRGFGKVRLSYSDLTLTYTGFFDHKYDFQANIYGVGSLVTDEGLRDNYGFTPADSGPLGGDAKAEKDGFRICVTSDNPQVIECILAQQVSAWRDKVTAK